MVLIIDINHLSPFVKSKLYDFLTFLSFYQPISFTKCLSEDYRKSYPKNVYSQRKALITKFEQDMLLFISTPEGVVWL